MRKKRKLISILIASFNKEKFIRKTLSSVINQTYKDFEIILYDDKSTDKSLEIIKKFSKIKIIRNKNKKTNFPPLDQINALINCFKKSKGEIICFLDADDIFMKQKLEIINSFFFENPKKNFVVNLLQTNKTLNLSRTNYSKKKWPSIFPTSSISIRRIFFKKFIKYAKIKEFQNLEIDARMIIFTCFFQNDFNILEKRLTKYIIDKRGISSKYKFLSCEWWLKRHEAYSYLDFILKRKNKYISKSFDYYVTNMMYKIILFFRFC